MKKKKLTFLADIAVLVLCVCAIAIGVYSAKNASLNVGGTVGFNAHDCEVDVYAEITGAVDAQNKAINEDNKGEATPFFRDGDGGNNPVRITGTQTWDFGKIYFDDLDVSDGKQVNDITFTFTITNRSAFYVSFDFIKPTLATGMSSVGKIDNVEKYTTILAQNTPITYTLTISLASAESDSEAKINDMALNFGKINPKTIDEVVSSIKGGDGDSTTIDYTTDSETQTVDMVFGSDSGNDSSGNAITYSGDIVIPRIMKKDNVLYTTNSVEFKTADYLSVTSLDVDAVKMVNGFGGIGSLSGQDIALKSININVDEDFSQPSDCFSGVVMDSVYIKSLKQISYSQNGFSSANIKSLTMVADTFNYEYGFCAYRIDDFTLIANTFTSGNFWFDPDLCPFTVNIYAKNISADIMSLVFKKANTASYDIDILESVYIEGGDLEDCGYTTFYNGEWNDMFYSTSDKSLYHLGKNAKYFPQDVKYIETNVLKYCGLENIVIPASVSNINNSYSSILNENIKSLTVDSGNAIFDSRNDCNAIIRTDSNTLILGCKQSTIPDTVTTINSYAFKGCAGLTEITIPNSVTTINEYAFSDCKDLTSLTIGNGVKSIGAYAFNNCTSLTTLDIPASVETINSTAFLSCPNLKTIIVDGNNTNYDSRDNCNAIINTSTGELIVGCNTSQIPSGVKSIGENAFNGCKGITSIIIPNTVTSIGANAFYNCTGLTSVVIPNSVTNIERLAFYNCNRLTLLNIPESVTSIGDSAFSNCTGLKTITVDSNNSSYDSRDNCNAIIEKTNNKLILGCDNTTIPSGVVTIADYALSNRTGLTTLIVPDSVTSIGRDSFSGCTSLTTVTLGSGVTSIGFMAFANCSSLSSINFPNGLTEISYYAFSDCTSLRSINIPHSVTQLSREAFRGCVGLTTVTLDAGQNYGGVDYVQTGIFSGCTGITTVTFGANFTDINSRIFPDSKNIISINVLSGNVNYRSENNCVIEKDSNTLVLACPTSIIPTDGSVTSIANNSLLGRSNFTEIAIPDSVTNIGSGVFDGCVNLKNSVGDLVYIKTTTNPYYYLIETKNKNITSATINENCKFIGNSVFYDCKNLTSITMQNGVIGIGDSAFQGCIALKNMIIPNSVLYIGNHTFNGCKGLTSITIGNSVTSIGYFAFDYCTGLTELTIPDSVTSIAQGAFEGCSNLTSLTMPDSLTDLGKDIFRYCYGLQNVVGDLIYIKTTTNPYYYLLGTNNKNISTATINENCKIIGSRAFYSYTKLVSVSIPASVISIGYEAFEYCSNLSNLAMENGLVEILSDAFGGCKKLSAIIIPDTVISIGPRAFSNCSMLTSVSLGTGLMRLEYYAFFNCSRLTTVIGENWVKESDLTQVDSSTLLKDILYDIKRVR